MYPLKKWAAKGLNRWDTTGILKRIGKTTTRPTANSTIWTEVQNTPNTGTVTTRVSNLVGKSDFDRYGMLEDIHG